MKDNPDSFLNRVADLCGQEVADRLAAAFGGTQIYIPQYPKPENRLCVIIGIEAVRRIAQEIGFGQTVVPVGIFGTTVVARTVRRNRTLSLINEGLSNSQIAQTLGVSQRLIERDRQLFREQGQL